MKEQTLRERRISYEKEALKNPMTEMQAAERIRKLIARLEKETRKAKSSAKSE